MSATPIERVDREQPPAPAPSGEANLGRWCLEGLCVVKALQEGDEDRWVAAPIGMVLADYLASAAPELVE